MIVKLCKFFNIFIVIFIFQNHYVFGARDENSTFYEQNWIQIFKSFDTTINSYSEQLLKQIKTLENELDINPFCLKSISLMLKNINKEEWAAKMVDSNGHLPSGILSGTITDFGDFDQCIKIDELIDNNMKIEGKYCFVTIRPLRAEKHKPIKINSTEITNNWFEKEVNDWLYVDNVVSFANGICFPSVCKKNEIKQLISKALNVLSHFEFDVNYCQTKEEPIRRTELVIALAIIKVMFALVLIGTLFDIYSTSELHIIRILSCFSIIKNTKILFKISVQKTKNEFHLQFIHGFRVLGTLWVIIAHSCGFIFLSVLMKISPFSRYPEDAIENSKTAISQYILNAGLAVQLFFIMSGFLGVYATLSKKKFQLSFINYCLLRWLRFTPPLVGMLCFTVSLELLGSGPLFQSELLKPYIDPCYDYWWAHILYVVNWMNPNQMCGIQTWYLGADFQIHILAFIVIYYFHKKPNISYLYTYLMIILGILSPIILMALRSDGMPRVDIIFKPKYEIPYVGVYLFMFGTHVHLLAYFSGVLIGFALLNNKKLSITKRWNTFIWIAVIFLTLTIPLLSYPLLQEDSVPINYSIIESIVFSLTLILWSMSISWILYNCAINRAGILPKILSANFLQPLSRLSFCAYLSHVMLIWYNVQQVRYPIAINALTIGQYFCTILVETFVMSYVLYLTFEAPFVNILKIVFLRDNKNVRPVAQEEEMDNAVNFAANKMFEKNNINNNETTDINLNSI